MLIKSAWCKRRGSRYINFLHPYFKDNGLNLKKW